MGGFGFVGVRLSVFNKGWCSTQIVVSDLPSTSEVYRSALIDVGRGHAGIVIEPEAGVVPSGPEERASFIADLRELGKNNRHTAKIEHFYFEKAFPVDVRHNAKIHRLSLARKYRMP